MTRRVHVPGLGASRSAASRTRTLVESVLEGAAGEPAVPTGLLTFADRSVHVADRNRTEDYRGDTPEALSAIDDADAVVFGMPVSGRALVELLQALVRSHDLTSVEPMV